jgi:hypothetical protein
MISEKRLERLKALAIKKAEECTNRCRHISFILYGSKIVSVGINQLKTDSFAYRLYKYPFVHSELDAIKKMPKNIDLSRCTLVNFRVSRRSNEFLLSKPCPSCTRLLDLYDLKDVYYTIDNEVVKL